MMRQVTAHGSRDTISQKPTPTLTVRYLTRNSPHYRGRVFGVAGTIVFMLAALMVSFFCITGYLL